jgi:Ser/Thr protein kinase RdoA (MazF antagonist)
MDNGSEMEELKELTGGRAGSIFKSGYTIERPSNPWTKNIHKFLKFINDQEKSFVPEPISFDKEKEIVSFLPGDAVHYPIPSKFWNDETLISAAKILRKLHDFGSEYINKLDGTEIWMNSIITPVETMCHGDFAPYNVTLQNNFATGIIDFDSLHPGPRMRDIGYAIYRWVPLNSSKNPDSPFEHTEKIRRTTIFLSEYKVSQHDRDQLVESMIQKLTDLVDFMQREADLGNEKFQKDISEGHHLIYQEDIKYLDRNHTNIQRDIEKIMGKAI